MNTEAFAAAGQLMAQIWRLFTGWHLPFTQVTPAMLIFLGLTFRLVIRLTNSVLGFKPLEIEHRSDAIKRMNTDDYI